MNRLLTEYTDECLYAVEMTREMHEAAIKEGISYVEYKEKYEVKCCLCETSWAVRKEEIFLGFADIDNDLCEFCPWTLFGDTACSYTFSDVNGFNNSEQSIIRLDDWEHKLLKIKKEKEENYDEFCSWSCEEEYNDGYGDYLYHQHKDDEVDDD